MSEVPSPQASQSWDEYNAAANKHASLRLSRQALRQASRSQPGGYSPTKRKGTEFVEKKQKEVETKTKAYAASIPTPPLRSTSPKPDSSSKKMSIPQIPPIPKKAEAVIMPMSYLIITGLAGVIGSWFFWHFVVGEKSFSYWRE
ncbi:hypothetical protein TrLO_g3260 [Triparma laevis f. longispina]|uniref:Uncharacterized protein n=1 Tax=Triparma laevis f. longispina TaxID=1714387 RepID=A0A9W7FTA8_9STRA|nr:hypothetical protein TrLO_g3260 [Triparma laevis f. longispina]